MERRVSFSFALMHEGRRTDDGGIVGSLRHQTLELLVSYYTRVHRIISTDQILFCRTLYRLTIQVVNGRLGTT